MISSRKVIESYSPDTGYHTSGSQIGCLTRSAFSLLEMLAVMVILSITLMIALPRMERFHTNEQSRAVQSLLVKTLEEARAMALRTGMNIQLVIQFDSSIPQFQLTTQSAHSTTEKFSNVNLLLPPHYALSDQFIKYSDAYAWSPEVTVKNDLGANYQWIFLINPQGIFTRIGAPSESLGSHALWQITLQPGYEITLTYDGRVEALSVVSYLSVCPNDPTVSDFSDPYPPVPPGED
ncbi:MAG: hypothetical protein HJJLKODD_00573 [Phycisphaerae bacterium]|nr:hypothetical protein [Phycisphaerae bacterium]